jgi:hyperosmotically inducible periplasmic protein
MQKRHSTTLLAATLAGIALFGAGCSDRNASDKVGEKMDRTTDKMSAAADTASARAAASIDDGTTTVKVKSALLTDPALKPLQISVGTKDGVVTLEGAVDSQELKERAAHIAQSVSGVKSVVDNLTIKTTG